MGKEMIRRRAVLALPLAVAAVSATGCGFGNSTNPNQNGKAGDGEQGGKNVDVLRESWRPVNHLNPAFGGGGSPDSTVMMAMMWEGLVIRDPDDTQNYLPGAAEKWEISDDGTVYTFHLRPGAKWSNGDPITANDFVWAASYYYNATELAKQGNKNPVAFNGSALSTNIVGLTDYYNGTTTDFSKVGIKATDDMTVEFTLTAPDYRFLDSMVKLLPLHQASVEANPKDYWMPGKLVGNGSYRLAAYNQSSTATMKLNENYWDAASYPITTREIQFNSSGATGMMVNYNANEIDLFRVDGDPAALIAGRPDLEPQLQNGTFVQLKGMTLLPTKDPILQKSPKLRQALAMALDREALAKVSPPDVAGPSWVPSGIAGAEKLPAIPFDVDKANQLLAEAGFANGSGVPTLSILTYATMPVLEAVASMWKEHLGINAKVQVEEVGVYSSMLAGDVPEDFIGYSFNYQAPSPFNMMVYGGAPYSQDRFVPYDVKRQIFDITHGKDKGKYTPAEASAKTLELYQNNWLPEYRAYAELTEKARDAQANIDEAVRLATAAATAFQETYLWVPLLWAGYAFMVKPRIKGIKLTSYADNVYSLKGATLDPSS